jgi:nitrilase
MSIVRAAVVQDHPVLFEREATIEKVRNLSKEAAAQEAELVLFPEAFVSAYVHVFPGHPNILCTDSRRP